MTRKINSSKGILGIAVATLIVSLWPVAAAEAVTVDGRVTASDGYSIVKNLTYRVENVAEKQPGAQLWLHQAGDDLFVGLVLPKTLVDNSYGATRIGWGDKNHKFQELVGSDKAQFVFQDAGGSPLLDVTLDFLAGTGKEAAPPYAADKTAKEFKVEVGDVAHVLAASSSLFYNWVQFGTAYPGYFGKDTDSPAAGADYSGADPAGWVFDVMYEFQINMAAFANANIDLSGGDFLEILHASPNKIGGNVVYDFAPPSSPAPVPEPLTVLALAMGAGALGTYLRRRRAA